MFKNNNDNKQKQYWSIFKIVSYFHSLGNKPFYPLFARHIDHINTGRKHCFFKHFSVKTQTMEWSKRESENKNATQKRNFQNHRKVLRGCHFLGFQFLE